MCPKRLSLPADGLHPGTAALHRKVAGLRITCEAGQAPPSSVRGFLKG